MNGIVLIDAFAEMLSDWFRPVLSKIAVPVGTVAGDQLPFVFQLPLVDPVQVASWAWAGIAASKAAAAAIVCKWVRIARSAAECLSTKWTDPACEPYRYGAEGKVFQPTQRRLFRRCGFPASLRTNFHNLGGTLIRSFASMQKAAVRRNNRRR